MFDRYWRLRVVGALACGAAAVAFAVWYAVYVLPIDLRAGKLAFTGIVAAIDVVFLLVGIAAYQLLKASPQRRRAMLRQEAMNGNQDAMPLARGILKQSPMMSGGDTSLEVRSAPAWQQWTGTLIRVALCIGFGTAFIVILAQLVPLLDRPYALRCMAGHEQTCVRFLATFMPLFALFLWSAVMLIGQACEEFASLGIASVYLGVRSDGIVRQRPIGHPRFIPWRDIGLLEVGRTEVAQGRNVKTSRNYICFARRSSFTWGHAEGAPTSSPQVRLAMVIAAHTGLQPRTFDRELVASDVIVQPSWVEKALNGFLIRLISVVLVVGAIAAFPLVPSRDIVLWAGFLIFCVFCAGMAFARLGRSKPAPSPFQAVTSDEQVITAQAGAVYEMMVGSYPLFVANQVLFAILGLLAAAFGAAFFYNEFDRSFLTNHGAPLVPVGPVSTIICVGVMAVGLALVVGAVRARDTVVLAELGGVRKRWLLGNVFIPWERVECVERARYWGYPGYRVVSSQPKTVIGWPIEPFQPSRKPQEAGAILTTPAQMAQVVAQRSGKPIREVGR